MNILLVAPRTPDTFWSFRHAMPLVGKKAAFPPLGLLTVAAMLPRTWHLRLRDLNVCDLASADLAWADAVFVSAMIVQEASARDVIHRALAAGKRVVAGGPLFTTGAERFPEVTSCVLGEAETIMPSLVADLVDNQLQPRYMAEERPSLAQTPLPRWDLINMRQYLTMPVQFSRGCPFDCEFCDITAIYGRTPRTKPVTHMIEELDALIARGWRGSIFMVDDNFIGHRAKAKALLRAIIDWRRSRGIHISFTTEASINLVDDPELLSLFVEAGFRNVFVGIESPQESSLRECRKVQNMKRDLVAAVRTMHRAGVQVMGGFIVGFDSDTDSIFAAQREFIQTAGIVTAMIGLLTALPGTRLFTRLTNEGRLLRESTGNNVDGVLNFASRLDPALLTQGYRTLVKEIYAPRLYYQRAMTFLRDYRPHPARPQLNADDVWAFLRALWVMGVVTPGRREFWRYLARCWFFHRRAFAEAIELAIRGHHFRAIAAAL